MAFSFLPSLVLVSFTVRVALLSRVDLSEPFSMSFSDFLAGFSVVFLVDLVELFALAFLSAILAFMSSKAGLYFSPVEFPLESVTSPLSESTGISCCSLPSSLSCASLASMFHTGSNFSSELPDNSCCSASSVIRTTSEELNLGSLCRNIYHQCMQLLVSVSYTHLRAHETDSYLV